MGRPVNASGEKTRQAILDAGLETFAEKGYFGASLRDIAIRVGVRESAIYNYFSGKEALFRAILDAADEARDEEWTAFLNASGGDARAVLERLTTRILEIFCEPRHRFLFQLLMSDGMRLARQGGFDLPRRMTSGTKPLMTLIQRLIAEGSLRPASAHRLAMAFMGPLMMWRQLHAVDAESAAVSNRQQFVRDHVEHFLHGASRVVPDQRVASPRRKASLTKRAPTRRTRVRSKSLG